MDAQRGDFVRMKQRKRRPEYQAWRDMISRCENPNVEKFSYYGGRGIKVCERWRNSFENFVADMGDKPSRRYTIERVDSNGDYEPSNCKWATRKEQCRNRRTNRFVEVGGVKMTVAEAVENYSTFSYSTVFQRLRRGLSPEEALTKPNKYGDKRWSRAKKIVADVAVSVFVATFVPTPSPAHDWARPQLDSWYEGLHRLNTPIPCCSRRDCHTTEAELRDGVWWARIGKPIDHGERRDWELGDYVRIPDEIIVRDDRGMPVQNPEGEAVICHDIFWVGSQISAEGTTVFCFVPGVEG